MKNRLPLFAAAVILGSITWFSWPQPETAVRGDLAVTRPAATPVPFSIRSKVRVILEQQRKIAAANSAGDLKAAQTRIRIAAKDIRDAGHHPHRGDPIRHDPRAGWGGRCEFFVARRPRKGRRSGRITRRGAARNFEYDRTASSARAGAIIDRARARVRSRRRLRGWISPGRRGSK